MALTYYLTIDGVDGGSAAPGPAGAFVVDDFSFDVSALVSALSGGASGKATFSPLTVDLTLASGLTTLLGDVASGKVIKSIELQGVTTAGTVYDLRLSNVVITRLHDSNSGLDSLSFDYSQGAVSLTTTPIDSTGGLGTPDTLSWDVANNVSLGGATLAPPVASSVDTGGGGAQTYYLTIDGVDGGSTASGHAGAFVIGDFNFDVSALVSALSGGAAGKATFPPLTVDLTLGSGLTTLLGDVAGGKRIKSIEIQGVTSGAQPATVYDLVLNNVFITRVHDSISGLDSLSFDYSQGSVSLTTTSFGSNGAPLSDTLSWDVANNVSLGGAALAPPVAGTVDTGGGGAQTYYLTIDGVDGGSTVSEHAGAFVVGDFNFDVSALVSALSGGGTVGKTTFSPLTVDLTLGSGLTTLLGDVASGKHIKAIELQGVSTSGLTVYDLRLNDVFITRVHDGNSGLDSLSFDYSQGSVSLTTTAINSDGSLASDTMSWDVAHNVSLGGATLAPPVAGSVDTGGGGAQTYYLTIDGVDGGSNASGHAGAFVIGDFSFDVSALVSALSSGKTTFSPLTVDLTLGSGLTTLLGDVASGKVIKSIELQGVATSGQAVYDLRLNDVFITRVHDGNSGLDSLSFDYSQGSVSLTTTPINSTGGPGTSDTMSWDVANNISLGGAILAPPVASSVDTGGGGAQTYYLTIDGIDGGSTASGHAGAFVIGDFNFDVSALVSALSGGKATFSPLTVDLTLGSGLTTLLGDVASGKHIKAIELQGVTSAGQKVYDLVLNNVFITRVHDSNSGLDSLSFDYSQGSVSLTTRPIRFDGSLGAADTLSWDVANNVSLGGATLAPPVAGSVDTGGGGAQTYYLTIDGVDGGSTASGHAGAFVIGDFSFDVSALVSALSGGGAAGKATFSPLTVDLTLGSGLTTLLGDVASGTHIKAIELQGVTSGVSPGTVYDLKLSNVVITRFHDSNSGLDRLSFDYSQGTVSLTTTPIKSDGSLGASDTMSWDVANNRPLVTPGPSVTDLTTPGEKVAHGATVAVGTVTPGSPGDTLTLTELSGPPGAVTLSNGVVSVAVPANAAGATLPSPVASSVDTGGGGAQTYYLTIDGVDGGSAASGHAGAFVIGDFSFDVSALVSALSGGAAGKATFSPLTVDLALGSGLTTLLGDVASGKVIKAIELQGVTSTGGTVYDLTLNNVVITRFHDSNSGLDRLSFDYSQGAVSLTTRAQNLDGSLGLPDTMSWDVANNVNLGGATLASPVAGSADTGGGGAQTYYLTIDGVDGGSQAAGHRGAFVIGDFNFDVSALVSALSGGGASGKATFSPLTVDLTLASGLTTLLGDVASGKVIKSIELQGVTSGARPETVYDLQLSNVVITRFHDSNSGLDSLSFDYSQGAVSLTTRAQNLDGSFGAPDTLSWDVANNVSLLGATLPPPVANSVDTGGGGAQTYYLTIDGVDGGSQAAGHRGAFVIGDFNFDVSALVSALSGGGAAGKATFSPLTVDLTLASGLTTLLGDVASGKVIKSIELQGVTTAGTVYDLTLNNVVITKLHDSNSGLDSLSFDYSRGAVSLTTRPQNPDGSLGAPDTLSWDVGNNVSLLGATLPPPVASSVDTGGGGAQTYYLTIDGVDGGSGHAGAFAISDFNFDVSALVSALSGGGAAGKTTFSPLTVDLTLASGLTTLLDDVASGKVIKAIELQGVTSTGQTVYDLTLNNVVITKLHDSNSGLDRLSFDYSQGAVSLTTRAQNLDGSLEAPDTLSWDVANNVNLGGATLASPVASSVDTGGGGAQTYYLTIDGVDGGSQAAGHRGAFVVGDFNFDVSALVSALSGGGGASGKATFSPLTVDLTLASGLTTLLGDVASGKHIKAIELQGVTTAGTVYDLTLSNVVITKLHDNNSGLDSLSFDYSQGAVSLTTTPIRFDGSLGAADTLSWDVANNVSLGGATLAPPVAGSVDTGGGGAQTYYLTIDGVDGGSNASGHAGAFVINDFNFDVSALVSALSGGGGAAGKATFSPLTVDLSLSSGLTTLLGDVASGKIIKSIELQGVTSGAHPQTVYDLRLSNVVITRFHDSSGLDGLSFDYSQGAVSLTTRPIRVDGSLGAPVTISWDVANNKPLANSSGTVAFSYQISDQLGNVSGVISDTLTIDPGPSVTDTTTAGETIAHGTTAPVGTVTPGLPGDTLTLTQLSGPPGAVTLANGIVNFTAPANGNGAFSYQISDQLGDVSAVVSDTLTIDPGPSVTDTTTAGEKVAHGTTVAVGTVTPGLPGDTLVLTELSGPAGAVTLANGVVSFAAPANASGNVAFSYQISDQLGDVSTVISDTLAVDPGPTAGNAHVFITTGQSVDLTSQLLYLDTPGLPGDTLSLSAIGTVGTLGTVTLSNGDLVYTGPTNASSDAFTYTVSDQLHESATASVSVSVLSGNNGNGNIALAGTGNIVFTAGGNHTVTGGSGGTFVSLGGGNDTVSLAGDNNTVLLGDGNDSVSLPGNNNTATLGNGNDTVTAGANSKMTLGNGNDTVTAGANSKITLGNGNDTVTAGANSNITLGSGHDTVAFGVGSGSLNIGNETVNNFAKGDTLVFNHLLLSNYAAAMIQQVGTDTLITIDPHNTVTLTGVAASSLTASAFKFV